MADKKGTVVHKSKNLEMYLDGKELVIRTNIGNVIGQSSTGKSDTICTTSGNIKVGDVQIGLNIYRKRQAAVTA